MALAALAATTSGCTGDDDDDGGSAGPGGIFNLTISSSGASSSASYAEFYSDFTGTFTSLRDIPIDTCVNPLVANTTGTPTFADVGATVTAVSGATTVTFDRVTAGTDITYELAADVAGAPDAADYDAAGADIGAIGTISVPTHPGTVGGNGGTATWTMMGADDAYVLVINASFTSVSLCHTADDGSYNFTALGVTSGLVAVSGANYAEADVEGRTVLLVGVAGDAANETVAFTP